MAFLSSVRLGCMFIVFNLITLGLYSPTQCFRRLLPCPNIERRRRVGRWRWHEPAVHGRPPRSVTAPAGVSLRAAVARGLQPFASEAAVDAHLSRSRCLCRDGAARAAGGQAEQDLGQRLGADGACCHSQAADGDEAGGRSSTVGGRCGTDHQGRANSLPHDEAADRGRGRRALCARQACPVR